MTLRPPVDWQDGFRVSQGFGENPADYERFGRPGHGGLDLAVPMRTPLYAVVDGRARAGFSPSDYGTYIRLLASDSDDQWYFCHLDEFAPALEINRWTTVRAGDLLGYSGSSGNSTGPHLHLELRRPHPTPDVDEFQPSNRKYYCVDPRALFEPPIGTLTPPGSELDKMRIDRDKNHARKMGALRELANLIGVCRRLRDWSATPDDWQRVLDAERFYHDPEAD